MSTPTRPRVRIPKVTVPATIYLVMWVDANYDTEHDGPSDEFKSELIECPYIGAHVRTQPDHIVLANEPTTENGRNHSRFHMAIPKRHVRRMIPLGTVPSILEKSDAGDQGDVPRVPRGPEGG